MHFNCTERLKINSSGTEATLTMTPLSPRAALAEVSMRVEKAEPRRALPH